MSYDFENTIEKKILKRGKDYYERGLVEFLAKDKDIYYFNVIGTEHYIVSVTESTLDGFISTCNCPYDFGDVCKHEVACYYYYLEELKNGKNINEFDSILQGLSKEVLIKELRLLLVNDGHRMKEFMMTHADNDQESSLKDIMMEFSESDNVYLREESWKEQYPTLSNKLFDIENSGDYLSNFKLLTTIETITMDYLLNKVDMVYDSHELIHKIEELIFKQYTLYTSNKSEEDIKDWIYYVSKMITDLTRFGLDEIPYKELELFASMGYSSTARVEFEKKLREILYRLEYDADIDADIDDFDIDDFDNMDSLDYPPIKLIGIYNDNFKDNVLEVKSNISSIDFYKRVLEYYLEKKKYDIVKELQETCPDYHWQSHEIALLHYKVYKELKDVDKIKSQLEYIVFRLHKFDYLQDLMSYFKSKDEFLDYITKTYCNTHTPEFGLIEVYLILEEYDTVLTYLEEFPDQVRSIYKRIPDEHNHQVEHLLIMYLHTLVYRAMTLKDYEYFIKQFKAYKHLFLKNPYTFIEVIREQNEDNKPFRKMLDEIEEE